MRTYRSLAIAIDGFIGRAGTEQQIVTIACGMRARGWKVRVLGRWGVDPGGEHAQQLAAAGVSVVARELPWRGAARRVAAQAANRLLTREAGKRRAAYAAFQWQGAQIGRGDIVHELPYFGQLPAAAYELHTSLRVPVVHTVLGTPDSPLRPVAPWAVMTTDGAPEILGSQAVWWIPCSTLTEPAHTYGAITSERERIELLFVGRLAWSKGVALLFEALRAAPKRFRLTVVGDGPDRARLEASAPPDVVFVGAVSNAQVIRRMRAAHVVVVPSHKRGIRLQEGMPTVIAEAMSQARPVLASAVGGVPRIFQRDGIEPGWLIEPDSVPALVRGLEAVAEADLESASRAAASTYNELLSCEAVLDAYEGAYESALLAQPFPRIPQR